MACDAERHVPLVLTPEEQERYGCDVSFAGAPYLNRRGLLPALADFDLRIWGEGWNDEALGPFIADQGRRFTLDQMVRVFAGSRINLNLHSAEHVAGFDPQPDYLNPRTFELAACEAFQLVDRRDPLRAAIKLYVTFKSLEFRRRREELFREGTYIPVECAGPRSGNVVAFARRRGQQWALAVTPRWLVGTGAEPPAWGGADWGSTALALPAEAPQSWCDVFTGSEFSSYAIGGILRKFPVALLEGR
jgi:hypothetical protein